MNKDKEIGWLYEELPSLVEKGIIPDESVAKLHEHYGEPAPSDKGSSRNLIFIISGILGSILIGLGIILLFAHNWDEYTRTTRTVLTFTPLIIAEILFGYAYFRQRDSIAWMESAAGFLMLMVGSSLCLIGQIYNLGGTLSELIFTWLLLSIPLIYFSRTVLPYTFYMILLTWWSFIADETVNKWHFAHGLPAAKLTFLVLALVMVPHIIRNVNRTKFTSRGNIVGWFYAVSLIIASSTIFWDGGGLATLLYVTCLATLLYALGKVFYDKAKHFWQKPFQVLGIISLFLLAIYCTFEDNWREFSNGSWLFGTPRLNHISSVILYTIGFLFFLVSLYILFTRYKAKKPVNYFPFLLPVIIALWIFAGYHYLGYYAVIIACNLFVLSYSIYYIYSGLKLDKTSLVNAGMFFLSVLIIVRFFSTEISFIFKGIIFILLGCCFLLVNYLLMKKRQKNG